MREAFLLLTTILLCLSSFNGLAQFTPIESYEVETRLNGTIDVLAGLLEIDTVLYESESTLTGASARLVGGEIIIEYTIPDPEDVDKEARNGYGEQTDIEYRLDIVFENGRDTLFIRPDKYLGEVYSMVGDPGRKKVVARNFVRDFPGLSGDINIILRATVTYDLEDPPECEEGRPTFTFRKKLPFLVAGVAGAGMVVGGILLHDQAHDDYREYQQTVDGDLGNSLFMTADNKHTVSWVLISGGIGLMAADAIWYFVRSKRHKKDLHMFNYYCPNGDKVGISPKINVPADPDLQGGLGLMIEYKF